jgi:hypothetical protein
LFASVVSSGVLAFVDFQLPLSEQMVYRPRPSWTLFLPEEGPTRLETERPVVPTTPLSQTWSPTWTSLLLMTFSWPQAQQTGR